MITLYRSLIRSCVALALLIHLFASTASAEIQGIQRDQGSGANVAFTPGDEDFRSDIGFGPVTTSASVSSDVYLLSSSSSLTVDFSVDTLTNAIIGFTGSGSNSVANSNDLFSGNESGLLFTFDVVGQPTQFDYVFSGTEDDLFNIGFGLSGPSLSLTGGREGASVILPVGENYTFSAGVDGSTENSGTFDYTYSFSGTFSAVEPEPFTWIDSGGGLFSDADNWDPAQTPTLDDDVLFNLPGTYTVEVNDSADVKDAAFKSGGVTFDLAQTSFNADVLTVGGGGTSAEFTLRGVPGDIVVSSALSAEGNITAMSMPAESTNDPAPSRTQVREVYVLPAGVMKILSTQNITGLYASDRAVIEGDLEMDVDTLLDAGTLIVGDNGNNGLVTLGGGTPGVGPKAKITAHRGLLGDAADFGDTSGGTGTINAADNAELIFDRLTIGDRGTGTLDLSSNAHLTVLTSLELGNGIGSTGNLLLSGAATASTEGRLSVGANSNIPNDQLAGTGTLTISGIISAPEFNAFGLVEIGQNGKINLTGVTYTPAFILGNDMISRKIGTAFEMNDASFRIADNIDSSINLGPGSVFKFDGTASVDRLDIFNTLTLGEDSTLEINIGTEVLPVLPDTPTLASFEIGRSTFVNATTVNVGGPGILGQLRVGGEIEDDRAELRAQKINVALGSNITLDPGGTIFLGGSTEILVDAIFNGLGTSQTDFKNKVIVLEGGELNFAGEVEAIGGMVIEDGGTVSTGSSPGSGSLIGDLLIQDGGRWIVEIAGTEAGDTYDVLNLTGNAVINGTIVFEFVDGFLPSEGLTFDFLNIIGTNDLTGANYLVRGLAPGWEFDVTPSLTGFQLQSLSDAQAIPEPSSLALVVAFSAAAVGIRCSRRS